jgi:FtsZ-interacting cell division protein ZipA
MRTRGLVFFLTLPGPEDMLQAFDYMLETARTVARNLGGDCSTSRAVCLPSRRWSTRSSRYGSSSAACLPAG